MASSHYVLAIGRHRHELGTPNHHHTAQHIHKAGYQVENVLDSVPLEYWDGDQVQIGQDTVDANVNAHVEEQAATMRATIPNNRKCPN
jgi:hypothetical protein